MNASPEYFPNHPAAEAKAQALLAAGAEYGYELTFQEYLPTLEQLVLVFRQERRGERNTRLRVEGHVSPKTGRVRWTADAEHHSGMSRPATGTEALVSWLKRHAISR